MGTLESGSASGTNCTVASSRDEPAPSVGAGVLDRGHATDASAKITPTASTPTATAAKSLGAKLLLEMELVRRLVTPALGVVLVTVRMEWLARIVAGQLALLPAVDGVSGRR